MQILARLAAENDEGASAAFAPAWLLVKVFDGFASCPVDRLKRRGPLPASATARPNA